MDDHHFAAHALARRADAIAESEHGHRMAHRLDQIRGFRAADPFRHHHALGVHVLQTVFLHLGHRPFDRAIECRRAAEPVADRVGQDRQALPRERARHRFANEAAGRLAIGVEPGRPRPVASGMGVALPHV